MMLYGPTFLFLDDDELFFPSVGAIVIEPPPEPEPEPDEDCPPVRRALDLICDAYIELGLIAIEEVESLDATMAIRAMDRLNNMRDTFNAEGLMIVSYRQQNFTLVVDNQNPTIGKSSATFTTDRPTKILKARLVDTSVTPNRRYPLEVFDWVKWVERPYSNQSDRLPFGLYYEPAIPNGIIHLSHKPTVAFTLELTTWTPWRAICELTDVLILEPSQYETCMYNLAVRLAPIFGVQLNPFTVQMASETKSKMKSINAAAQTKRQKTDVPCFTR